MKERWKSIPGFEGRYEVSDFGRVRSADRVRPAAVSHRCKAHLRTYRGKILKPAPGTSGHLSVVLGRGNTRAVHQLVMQAFVGPAPEGHEVLHRNHTPSDNRRSNLKYGTRGENLSMDYGSGVRVGVTIPVIGYPLNGGSAIRFASMQAAGMALKGQRSAASAAASVRSCILGLSNKALGHTWGRAE